MDRAEAVRVVDEYVRQFQQYKYVPWHIAVELLGNARAQRLLRDPIRRLGPAKDTVYPWNVVDYLQQPELRAEFDLPAPQ